MSKKDTRPAWSTQLAKRWPNGMCQGVDGSMWLYRKVPLGPVDDAVTTQQMLEVARPLNSAFSELERLTRVRSTRRRMVKSQYREIHALLINVPQMYVPDADQPLRTFLAQQHPRQWVDRRLLMFGVKIKDDFGGHGGLKGRVESLAYTLTEGGGVPMEDFMADFDMVDRGLKRSGLLLPDEDDFALADAWWNLGHESSTPILPHDDHLHVFANTAAMATAKGLEDENIPCEDWPNISKHHKLAMMAFNKLEFTERAADNPAARWASLVRQEGAAAISIRALLEPAKVTKEMLRRNKTQFRSDIREQHAADKVARTEMLDTADALSKREAQLAQENASPTLIDTSIIMAMNGADATGRFDARGVGSKVAAWSNMLDVQDRALSETMLCSKVRANPLLKDVPITTVTYSGLPSLSVVGDREGALLGFTERDHRPAYISHKAAYVADTLPIFLVAGATGSGKDFQLSTKLPTPLTSENTTGWTTVGEVKVGDTVFGRDGKPCKVTYLSPIKPMPPMYELSFSDGQKLIADADHQWVVSSFKDRNDRHRAKRKAAIENRNRMLDVADRLDRHAGRFGPDHTSTLAELLERVREVDGTAWSTQMGLYGALHFMEVPSHTQTRTRDVSYSAKETRKTDPAKLFDVHALLRANLKVWENTTGSNAVRWRKQLDGRIAAAKHLLSSVPAGTMDTAPSVGRMMAAAGAVEPDAAALRRVAYETGVQAVDGFTEVVVPLPESTTATWDATVFPTAVAFKALAERVRQQYHDAPVGHVTEQRMTTAEMLGAGLKTTNGQANFAIRLAGALDLPEVDLPVPPYVMGAWLGDGSSNCGQIASATADSCSHDGVSDQEHMVRQLQAAGYNPHRLPSNAEVLLSIPGLSGDLRSAGVLNNKHIPMTYLRASIDQRLALLQGLLDTDGTISEIGRCELTLCNERLASDALQLIRSLGIKATMHEGDAAYTLTDPETGEKTRTVTGTRYRIHFTTDKPVFRLPRKAERVLPEGSLRDTQQWLYITDIRPVESRPGRCIQVDSPDHTYLAGEGFVPSSNTLVLLYLAWQWAQLRPEIPQVIVDPKVDSNHDDVVELSGGQVYSLDDLQRADGVFDPLRFAGNAQAGVEVACSMLLQVDPWPEGKKRFESELQVALKHGVDKGATCIGQALLMAKEDGIASEELIGPIFQQVKSNAMFRACVGLSPEGEGLRVSSGITYIKVGDAHLDLPQPGREPESLNQRVAIALVKMMVFGSAMAMAGRGGVLHFDEAWVAMAGGATEVERLGRLARSQSILPVLYTQRVSDAVNNGLAGYISRGLIMHISDPEEAEAACALFKLEPDLFVERITMGDKKGGATASIDGAPEWLSLKALTMPPETPDGPRKVLRGSVAIYRDLIGRAVPVTVTMPPEFVEIASTNPDDINRKDEMKLRKSFETKVQQDEAERISEELGSAEHEKMARRAQVSDWNDFTSNDPAQSSDQTGDGGVSAAAGGDGDFDDIFAS